MNTMTLLEETRKRIDCCVGGTNEGWGELCSLRNHLGRVRSRVNELGPLRDEIEALPDDSELRADETIIELMQEHGDLLQALRDAERFLGIEATNEAIIETMRRNGEKRMEFKSGPRNLAQLLPEALPTLKNLGLIE